MPGNDILDNLYNLRETWRILVEHNHMPSATTITVVVLAVALQWPSKACIAIAWWCVINLKSQEVHWQV
jgi:hypothetical protein